MKRQHFLAAGLIILMTLPGTQASAEPVTVPIWKDNDGRPRVSVTFESGQSYDFIIDTGMMSTMIVPELVAALEQSAEPAPPNASKPRSAGNSALPVVIGGKINYVLRSPPVLTKISLSDKNIYGILGSEFLQQYAVAFDLSAGEMTLSEAGSEDLIRGAEYTRLPMYSPYANLWFTETEIDGVAITTFIDTGAVGTLINPKVIESIKPESIDLRESKKAEIKAGTGLADQSYSVIINSVGAGLRLWTEQKMQVSAGIFAQLRLANKPAMVMGSEMLLAGRLILDYPKGFVYFEVDQKEAI